MADISCFDTPPFTSALTPDGYVITEVPDAACSGAVPGDGIFTEGEIAAIRALIGVVPANTLYVGSSPLLVNGSYLLVA